MMMMVVMVVMVVMMMVTMMMMVMMVMMLDMKSQTKGGAHLNPTPQSTFCCPHANKGSQ